jgi:hypothetical protein
MPQKILGGQTDFSYGEVDVTLKRADNHPARKAGLRQMANARLLNSGGLQDRPGRAAVFPIPDGDRVEELVMSPGNTFKFVFGNGSIYIKDSTGVQVRKITQKGDGNPLPWTIDQVNLIVYAQLGLSVYLTFPGMRPQVISWDGVNPTGWSIAMFTELVVGNQKRTFFYRISPQNITIVPSSQTGVVAVNASVPIFTAAHVGTRIRYINRQMLITNVPGPYPSLTCGALVEEALPGHQTLTFVADPTLIFSVGDVVRGTATGSVGQVFGVSSGPNAVTIQLLNTNSSPVATLGFIPSETPGGSLAFTTADTLVGQGGSMPVASAGLIDVPAPTTIWDEEVMNDMRGYPASCFVDQFRLGFCDFPAVPNGIGWSAINSPTDIYVGGPTAPNGAIFEVAPNKVRVQHVVPGPEGSEFVFCDHKLFYIKIDTANPLIPGSVGFQLLSGDGAARVQPRVAQDVIFYVNAGGNSVMAVTAPGAYYRPFSTINLTEFHSRLFSSIVALAAPNADGSFNERYVYALNANGTSACGKYRVDDGKLSAMGWGPWSGVGSLRWIAATNADVLFTTSYFGEKICEVLDDSQYLDGAVFVNAMPPAFTPPPGMGPLWWLASQTTSLMDQSTRSMGTYDVDANGNIVPQGNAGENLLAPTLVAGEPWSMMIEPFAPAAQPGSDIMQRINKRQISRFAVWVEESTGFVLARLFSGTRTRTSPTPGTVVSQTRFSAYRQDDDPTLPPLERETVEAITPSGTDYDPRAALIKDTPGPLQLLEIAIEVSV